MPSSCGAEIAPELIGRRGARVRSPRGPVSPQFEGLYAGSMVDQTLRDRIRQLNQADRLELISELWESLETDQIEVTAEERQLLEDRLAELREHPDAGRPWGTIEAELRARR